MTECDRKAWSFHNCSMMTIGMDVRGMGGMPDMTDDDDNNGNTLVKSIANDSQWYCYLKEETAPRKLRKTPTKIVQKKCKENADLQFLCR